MGKVDGLIIPRSYNDYFSRSDPQAIQELVKDFSDNALSTISENPVQNKVITAAINLINALIPAQATAQNQLADKAFVNSSIGTNTANYISNNGQPFTSVAALEAYSGTVTNNDYAFVTGTDAAGNTYYDRYKATVSGSTVTWALEYRLNNSSFTSDQWAAITSGITAAKVAQYDNANIPVGFIMAQYKKVSRAGWLYLDGRDTTGTADELQTVYPDLYEYLGNSNVLPDYRECAIVGAEQNTSDTIETHDVYTEGQFKDDALQKITGRVQFRNLTNNSKITSGTQSGAFAESQGSTEASGLSYGASPGGRTEISFVSSRVTRNDANADVTRGKRKAAYFYIKAM
jgi:hypothetical protein